MALGYLISPALQIDGMNGKPLTGGTLRVARHGMSPTTPYITYKDFDGDRNPADVVLDAKGMAVLIADDANLYDIYCKDRNGVDQWSRLNVCTIGSGSGGGGGSYVAGTGIDIEGSTISVDTSAIQPILTAGDNISIVEDRISAFDTTYTATEPVVMDGTDVKLHVGSGLSVTSDGLAVDTGTIQTVLTFTDGLSESSGVVSLDNPTPAPSGSDSGKVLSVVDSSGTLGWVSQPTFTQQNADWTATDGVQEILHKPEEKSLAAGSGITITEGSDSITIAASGSSLPPYTGSDAGKVLSVSYNGTGTQWRDVSEVPSYAAVDQGKLLGVVNNGGTVELGWTQPIGYWTQSVDLSGNRTLTAEDISTGYIDFEGTVIASDTTTMITDPTYAALSWDLQVTSGVPSSTVSSIDFALGVSGGSYNTIFSDNSPAHDVHKDWGITSSWVISYRCNRVRARCHLASGATVGDTVYVYGGGIVIQVR